jgi:hypothetical protein
MAKVTAVGRARAALTCEDKSTMNHVVPRILTAIPVAGVALVLVLTANLAASYEEASVDDGGSILGAVVFNGPLPSKRTIVRTRDSAVCGSGVREVDQITVGRDKGVMDAIVYLKEVEKGKPWPKPATTPELNNINCDFVPRVQVIAPGDFVIVNSDPVLHNITGFFDKPRRPALAATPRATPMASVAVFNLALPNQGQRITRTIKRTGLIRLKCDAHNWMLGWAYVADNPYYAITSKDGTFTIAKVPAGSYTLVGWQEYTGFVEMPVTVKAGEAATITVELKK